MEFFTIVTLFATFWSLPLINNEAPINKTQVIETSYAELATNQVFLNVKLTEKDNQINYLSWISGVNSQKFSLCQRNLTSCNDRLSDLQTRLTTCETSRTQLVHSLTAERGFFYAGLFFVVILLCGGARSSLNLKKQMKEMELQLVKERQNSSDLSTNVTTLKIQLEKTQSDLDTVTHENSALEQKSQDEENARVALSNQRDEFKSEVKHLREKNVETTHVIHQQNSLIEGLKSRINGDNIRINNLTIQLTETTQKLENAEIDVMKGQRLLEEKERKIEHSLAEKDSKLTDLQQRFNELFSTVNQKDTLIKTVCPLLAGLMDHLAQQANYKQVVDLCSLLMHAVGLEERKQLLLRRGQAYKAMAKILLPGDEREKTLELARRDLDEIKATNVIFQMYTECEKFDEASKLIDALDTKDTSTLRCKGFYFKCTGNLAMAVQCFEECHQATGDYNDRVMYHQAKQLFTEWENAPVDVVLREAELLRDPTQYKKLRHAALLKCHPDKFPEGPKRVWATAVTARLLSTLEKVDPNRVPTQQQEDYVPPQSTPPPTSHARPHGFPHGFGGGFPRGFPRKTYNSHRAHPW